MVHDTLKEPNPKRETRLKGKQIYKNSGKSSIENTPEYQKVEDTSYQATISGLKLEKTSSTDLIIKLNLKKPILDETKNINFEGNNQGDISQQTEFNSGRWNSKEQSLFLQVLYKFGLDWRMLENCVNTRTPIQIKSHGQKVFDRIKMKYHTENPVEFIQENPSKFHIIDTKEIRKLQPIGCLGSETKNYNVHEFEPTHENINKLSLKDEKNNNMESAQYYINNVFFSNLDEKEIMILINRFLIILLKEIKEKEGGIKLLNVLDHLKIKSIEKLKSNTISKRMNKFLRRLIKVIKQQFTLLDKYFHDFSKNCINIKKIKSENENLRNSDNNPNIESNLSSFQVLNPVKAWKFRKQFSE